MRALILKQSKWAALCVLLLSGCASADPRPSPMQDTHLAGGKNTGDETDASSSFDNLELVDADLNGKVAILRVGSDPSANNLLSVFAGLKNKTANRLALEVETIYKDKDGNALNAGSWIPMTLKPHEEKEYRSASISVEAVDFLIRVRRAQAAP